MAKILNKKQRSQDSSQSHIQSISGAKVHLDRIQPFLLYHQKNKQRPALVAEKVSITSGNYCLVDDHQVSSANNRQALVELFEEISLQFRRFLFFDLVEESIAEDVKEDSPDLPQLFFVIECSADQYGDHAVLRASEKIADILQDADLRYLEPMVETIISERDAWLENCTAKPSDKSDLLRIRIPSVYYVPGGHNIYPELLEKISAAVYDAILQGIHEFSIQAKLPAAKHYRAYGRNVLVKAAKQIDSQIDEICTSFDFLLGVTPINSEHCWSLFSQSGYSENPQFRYRPLTFSLSQIKRKLHSINVDIIEDPVLIQIFQEKQRELDNQLTLLDLRNTEKFKQAGVMLYGEVTADENETAKKLLDVINSSSEQASTVHSEAQSAIIDCHGLKAEAETMVRRYQTRFPSFSPTVTIRNDIPAGLMVSGERLLISRHSAVPEDRVNALLNHEIGVHLVTYFAGCAQPLRIFRSGLAGYEGIQEGLGVFAEYAVGGLTQSRLKLLAGRVVACYTMLAGADFVETFRTLHDGYNFSPKGAFNIAMRVQRSGGLPKDAIYLRGLLSVLSILKSDGNLEAFWIGKIAPHHVSDVKELIDRNLIVGDTVKPEFLHDPKAQKRISDATDGLKLHSLLD